MSIPTFKTARLCPRFALRELQAEDWREIFAFTGDERVSRYQAWAPHSEADSQDWVNLAILERAKEPRRTYYWGISLSQKIIGGLGLELLPVENAGSAEIGYSLHRDHWGKGYGTEVLRAGLTHVFGQIEIRRVVAHCRTENIASIRVLEKCGFRREGHFVQDVLVRGKPMDSYWYAILRDEFIGPKC